MLVISKFFLILISDNIWYFLMFYHSKSLYLSSCTVFSIDKQTNIFLIVINIDATDIAMDNQQVLFNVHKRDIIKKADGNRHRRRACALLAIWTRISFILCYDCRLRGVESRGAATPVCIQVIPWWETEELVVFTDSAFFHFPFLFFY